MIYQSNHICISKKSYISHTVFAFCAGFILIFAGLISVIHAIIPNLFPDISEKLIIWALETSKKQKKTH